MLEEWKEVMLIRIRACGKLKVIYETNLMNKPLIVSLSKQLERVNVFQVAMETLTTS